MKKKIGIIGCIILVILVVVLLIFYNVKNEKISSSDTVSLETGVGNVDFSNYEEQYIELSDSTTISSEGVYHITGSIENGSITVNTSGNVKLILDNVSITNNSGPAINVESAKNVYIELVGKSSLEATVSEEENGCIFSKSDLLIMGEGTLNIKSNIDGIISKDDLQIDSGTINIETDDDGLIGRDSILINNGTLNIKSSGDAIKSTNEEKGTIEINGGNLNLTSQKDGIDSITNVVINDGVINITSGDTTSSVVKTNNQNPWNRNNSNNTSSDTPSTKGIKADNNIYINGGTIEIVSEDDSIHSNNCIEIKSGKFTLTSKDDAIHADAKITINGGEFTINGSEGIEATYVLINDGDINITASDDGINAGNKSSDYTTTIEINGGNVTITMGQGDTDGIDSNGNLYLNGGTINITGQNAFDYDGEAKNNGATIIVNGETTDTITNQFMNEENGGGQGMQGGMKGQPNAQEPQQGAPNEQGQNQNSQDMQAGQRGQREAGGMKGNRR